MPEIARRAKRVVEATIQDRIVKALSAMPDVFIRRNLVGTYETVKAGWIRAGLGPGTPDLIGWLRVPVPGLGNGVDPIYVARFLALEVKAPGGDGKQKAREAEQAEWREMASRDGVVAELVHSEDEAVAVIEEARRWSR